MCQADGKEWGHYWETKDTQDFIAELESDLGIPRSLLVRSTKAGSYEERGTRIHRRVAYDLAAWLSPETSYAMIELLDKVSEAQAGRFPTTRTVPRCSVSWSLCGCRTTSTSTSRALSKSRSRSVEKPVYRLCMSLETSGWLMPNLVPACRWVRPRS